MSDTARHHGHCLCGAVAFIVAGPLLAPGTCHCRECRRQSGHVWASVEVDRRHLTVAGSAHLRWYAASPLARRGFCAICGSFLFWDPAEGPVTEVALGALDGPTGVRLERHGFVSEQGDYYDIADGLPQNAQ